VAVGQITIGIPGNSSTNFANSPVTQLVLKLSAPGTELAPRPRIGRAISNGYSNRGTAIIGGPAYNPKYQWAITSMVTQDQYLHLAALAFYQQDKISKKETQSQWRLRLIDETEYVEPEHNPHSRVLLQSITPSWAPSYRYGYGVFDVKLEIPEDFVAKAGKWASGSECRLVTFGAVEL
jgi:hypothetical protein